MTTDTLPATGQSDTREISLTLNPAELQIILDAMRFYLATSVEALTNLDQDAELVDAVPALEPMLTAEAVEAYIALQKAKYQGISQRTVSDAETWAWNSHEHIQDVLPLAKRLMAIQESEVSNG